MIAPCACACSGCPHILLAVIISHVCGQVVRHVVLVWFFHLQLQAGRHLPGQGRRKTCCGSHTYTDPSLATLNVVVQTLGGGGGKGGVIWPLKASTWWLSSLLEAEVVLGSPPWLLFRLAPSSVWALLCCCTGGKHKWPSEEGWDGNISTRGPRLCARPQRC